MNILVIGGNGFIGSHLVDQLLLKGHKIRVFDVSYEHYRNPIIGVDYRISTLNNIPDLYEALLGIDIVFHLASSSVPSTSNIDTVSDINNNLVPTLNVLNLLVKLDIKRIIYFSSGGAVYGNPLTTTISEEHPISPISSYGIVKSTIEKYLFLYQNLHGLKPLILRPSNPYGMRQGHYMAQGVISTFLRKIRLGEKITVFGDGNNTKDYIYIKDLIDLCCELSFSDEEGIFNLGSGIGTSINQIIDQIKKTTGLNPEILYTEKQSFDVNHFILDISKVLRVVGGREFTSLDIGIKELWDWMNVSLK